jgi:hypothetical protein
MSNIGEENLEFNARCRRKRTQWEKLYWKQGVVLNKLSEELQRRVLTKDFQAS